MATTSPDNIWTPDSGDDYALTVDLAATADTVQAALLSHAAEALKPMGVTGPASGVLPAAPNYGVKLGSSVVTADSASIATVNYPGGSFTGGAVVVLAVPGDPGASTKQMIVDHQNTSVAGFKVQCLQGNGTGVGAVSVRVNWVAFGWNA